MPKPTFGSLFAGIGGFDLGFERAGFKCEWQVEIDDYATKILEKHWPKVHRERDIRQCGSSNLERVDCIIGGFPCQDISCAGRGAGLAGERSGLFFEAVRLVRELQPRAVVLENVAALLTRGLDRVLGTLAEIGYDAQWHCIPAAAVGAPHIRDRVFVIAYSVRDSYGINDRAKQARHPKDTNAGGVSRGSDEGESPDVADANGERARHESGTARGQERECAATLQPAIVRQDDRSLMSEWIESVCSNVADTDLQHGERGAESRKPERKRRKARIESGGCSSDVAYANSTRLRDACGSEAITERYGQRAVSRSGWWDAEPAVGRVANGIPKRVDRLRCLGNAIVPQVAEVVAKMTKQQLEW